MKELEFKGSTVESAIEKGLKKLGLTREDVEIEVLNEEGVFTKATVRIVPIEKQEEVVEENEEVAAEEEEVVEEKTEKAPEQRRERNRAPREKRDYFPEEKAIGKECLKTIASYFTDKARIDVKSYEDEICFYIGGEDSKIFIGHRGETLDAIQYILSQILNKDKEEENGIRITVDADFYRERRKRILTGIAKKAATKAYNEKREVSLEPMNSYERRIIHSALQNSEEATTRSEGEGKDRHIVIVPKCEVMKYGNVSYEFRKKGPGRTKSYGGKKTVY